MRRSKVNADKWGMIFCLPFIVAFLIFTAYPIIYTLLIGFTDLRGLGTKDFSILADPFENFKAVLGDPNFTQALGNTIMIWVINFIPQILLALLLTAWFTSARLKIRGQGAFKVILYMPNIITAATVAMLFNAMFQFPQSPMNEILKNIGALSESYNFLQNEWVVRGLIAFIQFWMWYGQTMIVLIAGVLGISPTLFEASQIDGANGWQTFWYVTLPNLRTIITYTLVTSMIGGLQIYDIPSMIMGVAGNNGPNNVTRTAAVFIYQKAFSGRYIYNQAAAASIVLFAIIAVLAGILFYVLRDKDAEKLTRKTKAYNKQLRLAQKGGK